MSYKTFNSNQKLKDFFETSTKTYYSDDGKWSLFIDINSLYVSDTSNFFKSGESKVLFLTCFGFMKSLVGYKLCDLTVQELFELPEEKINELKSYCLKEYNTELKNNTSYFKNKSCHFNTPFTNNVKPNKGNYEVGKRLSKTDILKILISKDYHTVECNHYYTDDYVYDNNTNFGKGKLVEENILDLIDDILVYKLWLVRELEVIDGYELIRFSICSNDSYTIYRKLK